MTSDIIKYLPMDNLINSSLDKELSKLSPFELKGRIIAMANEKVKRDANTMLNAGRGNPNWVATESRDAFFALGMFAMTECRLNFDMSEGIAGVPQKEGISVRFETWLRENASMPGVKFLSKAYEYCLPARTRLPADSVRPARQTHNYGMVSGFRIETGRWHLQRQNMLMPVPKISRETGASSLYFQTPHFPIRPGSENIPLS